MIPINETTQEIINQIEMEMIKVPADSIVFYPAYYWHLYTFVLCMIVLAVGLYIGWHIRDRQKKE